MKLYIQILVAGLMTVCCCRQKASTGQLLFPETAGDSLTVAPCNKATVIHTFVALCDNKYQGIVPVPKKIGNGQDPDNNLYWGCGYGVRTYFSKSKQWTLLEKIKNPKTHVLERLVLKHKSTGSYLVADAYDGQYMAACLSDYLRAASGEIFDTIQVTGQPLLITGCAQLTAFVGHNGLMEYTFENMPAAKYLNRRETMLLCCQATQYFGDYLRSAGATPLLWTTGNMAPEAYTLHDAFEAWLAKKNGKEIKDAAATAYHTYQQCGRKAAGNLFRTGF